MFLIRVGISAKFTNYINHHCAVTWPFSERNFNSLVYMYDACKSMQKST